MDATPAWAWLVIAGVTAGAILGFMLALAGVVRNEAEAQELRQKVDLLRQSQKRRLMAQSEYKGVEAEVDEGEQPVAAPPPA
ncbi:MAG: hypothetical protein IT437_12265 [Phycisphaerales bacterium]|nr:hypothetical protein [Phycisphaerales bacterium]